jgi:hypothetical protein
MPVADAGSAPDASPTIAVVAPADPSADRPVDALELAGGAAAKPSFGAKDSWRLNLEGDWIGDFEGANEFQGRVGAAWFFVQDAELALYGTGGYVWQPGTDAGTYGLDLEVRWHCIAREDWSVFLSIGGSVMGATEPVPSGGTSFCLTPSAGFGATLEVAEDTRLYLSARWYHISNGGTSANNPGRDNLSLWAGLSFGL